MWTKIVRFLVRAAKFSRSAGRKPRQSWDCGCFLSPCGRGCRRQERGAAKPLRFSFPLAGEDAEGRRGSGAAAGFRFYFPKKSGAHSGGLQFRANSYPSPQPSPARGEGARAGVRGAIDLLSPLAGGDAEGRRGERRSRCFWLPLPQKVRPHSGGLQFRANSYPSPQPSPAMGEGARAGARGAIDVLLSPCGRGCRRQERGRRSRCFWLLLPQKVRRA